MKYFKVIFFFLFCTFSAQQNLPFDSLKLQGVKDLYADDYGNVYLYKNKDFSFIKYDSLGKRQANLMLTLPFKIQSVQNPLNISSFSENAQEVKYYDQNLVEIQTVNFRQRFGFIKLAYAEDLQQIWLLDGSTKRLIQYNFREDRIINSFPLDLEYEGLSDILVYENRIYLITQSNFLVYNFKAEKLFETNLVNAKRLRRENRDILIIGKDYIKKFENSKLESVFSQEESQIVDKNSTAYFVIKDNKLYLYPITKQE